VQDGLWNVIYDETLLGRFDRSEGPTAGTETVDPLEFLARVLVHIPDKGTSRRGTTAGMPTAILHAPRLAPPGATRRWAALLPQIFEVDPLACPTCHGTMRVVAFITQASVIDQILAHLRAAPRPRPTPAHRVP
jgi:hypothetical protein